MRDHESTDIDTAARLALGDAWPQEREQPSREDVADLEPRPAFTPHPRAVKINGWTYVRPRDD